jgi:hypothetical protein
MPTASQIAVAARCSVRSVFERFSDLDALTVAAADFGMSQALAEAAASDVGADRATRIRSHVRTRAMICEKWLPLWRIMATQQRPELETRVAVALSAINGRIQLMYRPELSTTGDPERDQLILALATLISFESWDQLRHSHNLSMEEAQAVWRLAIDRMLPR